MERGPGRACVSQDAPLVTLVRHSPVVPTWQTVTTHNVLIKAADGLVAGGETETFTPMFFFVARKVGPPLADAAKGGDDSGAGTSP